MFPLGKIVRLTGKMKPAVAEYRTHLRDQPQDSNAWNNLGEILLELGIRSKKSESLLVESLTALHRARELIPEDIDVLIHLGRATLALGQPRLARESLTRAQQLAGPGPNAVWIKKLLAACQTEMETSRGAEWRLPRALYRASGK